MREYVVRRLLLLIPTAFLATVIMFTLMKLVPGDVAMAIVYSNEEEASATTIVDEGGTVEVDTYGSLVIALDLEDAP